jgi:hypothetical protein
MIKQALSESRMREIRPSGSNERGVETERGSLISATAPHLDSTRMPLS